MKLASLITIGLMLGVAHAGDMTQPEAPGYPGPGSFQAPPRVPPPFQQGLRIERTADEQGYYMRIHLGGLEPQAVQVTPMGRSLLISTTQSVQSEHRQAPQQPGLGYRQWSYSTYRSSGSMQRRVSVPRDADMGAMQRADGEGMILITLPRVRGPAPQGRYD